MKNIRTLFLLLFFFLSVNLVKAQIQLVNRPIVTGVACQRITLGSIFVNVKQLHPPYNFQWNTGQTSPGITDLEPGDYSVKITDANGADTTMNFTIKQQDCTMSGELFFTPNGDGINDYWHIRDAQYFKNALILVFNRLGQVVYRHSGEYTDDNKWDGTDLLGQPLPVSTYYFVIYLDKSDKGDIVKGTVSIIR